MLFLTILFFTYYCITLFRGNLFSSTSTKLKEIELKRLDGGDDQKYVEDFIKEGCFPIVIALILAVLETIYLIKALNIDPYKLPTIAAIVILIIGLIGFKKKKNTKDMNESELIIYKAKLLQKDKRSFFSTIKTIMWTAYFGYMFYILVFLTN